MDSKSAIIEAESKGMVEVSPGVWLWSSKDIMADQKEWPDGDSAKCIDLSTSPFWITDDTGIEPMPIDEEEDLKEFLGGLV